MKIFTEIGLGKTLNLVKFVVNREPELHAWCGLTLSLESCGHLKFKKEI